MKNERNILLLICALSLAFVLGMFTGRNTNLPYKELQYNDNAVITPDNDMTVSNKLDINTANKEQLMELPGIGDVIAERIIAYRTTNGPFSAVDQILNVEGIGKTKFQQIETYIYVGG